MTLTPLLHLCDSLFPTGGFAHSDGLEAATAAGTVASVGDLRCWMAVLLEETLGRSEALAVALAWHAHTEDRSDDLERLDAEVHALRPSSAGRAASRAMGTRLLRTWRAIRPELELDRFAGMRLTLPVAFALAGVSAGIDRRATVEGFIYARLAATVSSAMRLMPLGQTEAHALLAEMLVRVPAVLDAIEGRLARAERPGAFAPAFDVATMSQQHVRSRLFLS
jgi:urease accessory protein